MIVEGPDPVGVASLMQHMPGIKWISVGLAAGSFRELVRSSVILARNYLRKRDLFCVEAEGSGGTLPSDVGGAVTSEILESVKGARVSLESPKVRFRAAYDGVGGVVGVQIMVGPGGVSSGREQVACLVSGGAHSSVVAWMAALAGFRLQLVHAKSDDEGLLAVARLYSELSHRTDPRGLYIEVLSGDAVLPILVEHARRSKLPIFGGFHSGGSGVPRALRSRVMNPLYLLQEEAFSAEFVSLGIRSKDTLADWSKKGSGRFSSSSFGGAVADVSDVLDGLS